MKWLLSFTSTTNEQEYGKKERADDHDEYFKSSKAQERTKKLHHDRDGTTI